VVVSLVVSLVVVVVVEVIVEDPGRGPLTGGEDVELGTKGGVLETEEEPGEKKDGEEGDGKVVKG